MKVFYDLHIHTALSPCGDQDMTPNNIVNMALLANLNVIAITDHNAADNVEAVQKTAEGTGLVIIPGMELETSEEVHCLCLFPSLEALKSFEEPVKAALPKLGLKEEIFGRQSILDESDNETGVYPYLLVNATGLELDEAVRLADKAGGILIPAHVDRTSYSVISNLGFIPPDLKVNWIEFSKNCNIERYLSENKRLFPREYLHLQNSDAHYLQDINEAVNFIELPPPLSAESFIRYLKATSAGTLS